MYELEFTGTDVSRATCTTVSGTNGHGHHRLGDRLRGAAARSPSRHLSPYAGSDNTFNATSPYVDFAGVSFSTAVGGDYNLANIGSAGAPQLVLLSSVLDPGGGVQVAGLTNIALTVTAVPEPGNLALMLAGALGLFGIARRRAAR